MTFKESLQQAADYLAGHDPVLKPVIERAGRPTLQPHKNYYWELIDSIISQQLSVKAATSIEKRFRELFGTDFPAPLAILEKSIEDLRAVGLSRPKARYIQDLAQHILDGQLKFDKFDRQTNDEIITELIAVKGIGEWTAHMFLIFCMGRLDVLPTGDLGIRNGIRQLYNFKDAPTPDQIRSLAQKNRWHPYESVASWYVWRSLGNTPAV
ncbi:MAG TPA: DNA-3-methyladenine glycosylase [Verrucomicrobiae bacterium]|nr:DNA-3-methyladenine glycosylase [Verrucomicrobiae bacterium]